MDRVPGFEPGGWRFEPSSVRFYYTHVNSKSIFSQTFQSYTDAIFSCLGKGKQHIALVYEEIMRKGRSPQEDHPAFKNNPALLSSILSLTEMGLPQVVEERSDGVTKKLVLKTEEGFEIETVLIPMHSGGTLCISSQIGCRLGCVFCETGRLGLLRHLRTEEIIAQVFIAKFKKGYSFRNVVFMGMGEPFDNYEAVMNAARILIDAKGMGFGRKNVTISTSGLVEGIKRFAEEGKDAPNLAVSVNAPTDEIRHRLMPINRQHNMAELYAAMLHYCARTQKQILAAYVLLKGVNDSENHADRLAAYLKGLDVKINLIPYNPQSCDRFQPPCEIVLNAFAARLRSHGFYTLLRVTKGREIMAGCGQLGNLELKRMRVRTL